MIYRKILIFVMAFLVGMVNVPITKANAPFEPIKIKSSVDVLTTDTFNYTIDLNLDQNKTVHIELDKNLTLINQIESTNKYELKVENDKNHYTITYQEDKIIDVLNLDVKLVELPLSDITLSTNIYQIENTQKINQITSIVNYKAQSLEEISSLEQIPSTQPEQEQSLVQQLPITPEDKPTFVEQTPTTNEQIPVEDNATEESTSSENKTSDALINDEQTSTQVNEDLATDENTIDIPQGSLNDEPIAVPLGSNYPYFPGELSLMDAGISLFINSSNLSLTNTASKVAVSKNEIFNYKLDFAITGVDSSVTTATITDVLDSDLTYIGVTVPTISGTTITPTYTSGTRTLTVTLSNPSGLNNVSGRIIIEAKFTSTGAYHGTTATNSPSITASGATTNATTNNVYLDFLFNAPTVSVTNSYPDGMGSANRLTPGTSFSYTFTPTINDAPWMDQFELNTTFNSNLTLNSVTSCGTGITPTNNGGNNYTIQMTNSCVIVVNVTVKAAMVFDNVQYYNGAAYQIIPNSTNLRYISTLYGGKTIQTVSSDVAVVKPDAGRIGTAGNWSVLTKANPRLITGTTALSTDSSTGTKTPFGLIPGSTNNRYYYSIDSDSSVNANKVVVTNSLPKDGSNNPYARIDAIRTGKFNNFAGSYQIFVKTNTRDYFSAFSGTAASSSSVINTSTLSINNTTEYITDIKIELNTTTGPLTTTTPFALDYTLRSDITVPSGGITVTNTLDTTVTNTDLTTFTLSDSNNLYIKNDTVLGSTSMTSNASVSGVGVPSTFTYTMNGKVFNANLNQDVTLFVALAKGLSADTSSVTYSYRNASTGWNFQSYAGVVEKGSVINLSDGRKIVPFKFKNVSGNVEFQIQNINIQATSITTESTQNWISDAGIIGSGQNTDLGDNTSVYSSEARYLNTDINGDSSTTSSLVYSTVSVKKITVSESYFTASVESITQYSSGAGTNYPRKSTQFEGGTGYYRLNFTSTRNIRNFEAVITLPHINDTSVLDSNIKRNSELSLVLKQLPVVKIGSTTQNNFTIYYSQSSDPVRFNTPNGPIGTVNDWTTTPPANLETVKAIKIAQNSGNTFRSQSYSVDVYVGAPSGDPALYRGKTGWASYAYQAESEPVLSSGNYVRSYAAEPTMAGIVVGVVSESLTIGNQVFNDSNNNGVLDSGEPGVGNVKVELLSNADAVLKTTYSSVEAATLGQYAFANLQSGQYKVRFTAPSGTKFTKGTLDVDNNSQINDPGSNIGTTSLLTISPDGTYNYVDAGLVTPSTIGDLIWLDTNGDGIKDAGENGISGLTVKLLDSLGSEITTTTTNASGNYSFTGLMPGSYYVEVVAPGYLTTKKGATTSELDSNLNANFKSDLITITSAVDDLTIDGGLVQPATVGNFVWEDTNYNGTQDGGELGISGVTVELIQSGTTLNTTTTDANGAYSFTGLTPGSYDLKFSKTGYYPTKQVTGDTTNSDINSSGDVSGITLISNQTNNNVDAGFYQKGSIGDIIWKDQNKNGQQDAGELGIANVTLKLMQGVSEIASTTTDASGNYLFSDLIPGTYQVKITIPTYYHITTANSGNDATDSDFVVDTTGNIVINSNTHALDVDGGLYQDAKIGDFVWNDLNANGIQDNGEPGLEGVTLHLLQNSAIIDTAITDANGQYTFNDIQAGTYQVEIVPLTNTFVSTSGQGSDNTIDSDFTNNLTSNIVINGNENLIDIDGGLYYKATIGNFVWEDLNGNGIQDGGEPGIQGVLVQLKQGSTVVSSTTTTVNGLYALNGITPGTYDVVFTKADYIPTIEVTGNTTNSDINSSGISNQVINSGDNNQNIDAGFYRVARISGNIWEDADNDGIQDEANSFIEGVTIKLLQGNTVVTTTSTDASGYYQFTNLAPGDYQIEVIPPFDMFSTKYQIGSDATLDNDFTDNKTAVISLQSNQVLDNIDGGLFYDSLIGNLVWDDLNHNGIQDAGEPGIDNVTIKLYDEAHNEIASTTTDSNGNYVFDELFVNNYYLAATLPNNYLVTKINQGSDDTKDSDFIEATAKTAVFYLASHEDNNDYDLGLYRQGEIGNFVWEDLNFNGLQDASEPGIENVVVNLKQGATTISSKTTDQDGAYLFTGIEPGTYDIEIVVPSGYSLTKTSGSDDASLDSNFITSTISGYSVVSGTVDHDVDAGIYQTLTIGDFVWEDLNGNGVQDNLEPGIAGVSVELKQGSTVILSTTTDANGNYSFASVAPGTYDIKFTKAGYLPTLEVSGDTTNSDINSSGVVASKVLNSGGDTSDIDAGFYRPASVGNYVWLDMDNDGIQEVGEDPFAGATIRLFKDATELTSTTSASDGSYSFENLMPGDYVLKIDKIHDIYSTKFHVGSDDTIDSDFENLVTSTITLTSNEVDNTIDAGLFYDSEVGNFVWDDKNFNGIQDDGEPGIAGVTIELKDTNDSVVMTAVSDSNGAYLFDEFFLGTYYLEATLPNGYIITKLNQGSDQSKDNDFIKATNKTNLFSIASNEYNYNLDLGLYQKANYGGIVWEDNNYNGIQNNGELGIESVTIKLKQLGSVVATTTTNASGVYNFEVDPGVYDLEIVLPTDGHLTIADIGGDESLDSDFRSTIMTNITITGGTTIDNFDAGLYFKGSLGDFVWHDLNYNGIQDAGEPGISGVQVDLKMRGTTVATTTTDANGNYLFEDILPGNYTVQFTNPGYYITVQNAAGSDFSSINQSGVANAFVGSSITTSNIDAGFYKKGSISNYVWKDLNFNGIRENGEPGVYYVLVELILDGNVVKTTRTDASGQYLFTNVNPGSYHLRVNKPSELSYTLSHQGSDNTIDSDFVSNDSELFALTSEGSFSGLDMGLYSTAKVGNRIWHDRNINGVQESGEPGIPNVTVILKQNGFEETRTTTNESGVYSFDNLEPGTYTLSLELSSNMVLVAKNSGSDVFVDSDFDTVSLSTSDITLISGEINSSIDGGIIYKGSIGNRIWKDSNNNGIQDIGELGVPNVALKLMQGASEVTSTQTNSSGIYQFNNVIPGTYQIKMTPVNNTALATANFGVNDDIDSDFVNYETADINVGSGENISNVDGGLWYFGTIGDYVWHDLDVDGVQDAGEAGIENVTLKLYNSNNDLVDTVVTNSLGKYQFLNVVPGTYKIEMIPGANRYITKANQGGNDLVDSDFVSGFATNVIVNYNETVTNLDGGVYYKGIIGNFVWKDINADGIQDVGEPGMAGVELALKQGTTTIATAISSSNGLYTFTDVEPGTYKVVVVSTNGMQISEPGQGSDNTKDSDFIGGETSDITVISQTRITNIDLGVYQNAIISNRVWDDSNANGLQDIGELGVAGIDLTLKQGSTTVTTTTTNESGIYSFKDLKPGTYQVYITLLPNTMLTQSNVGSDDSIDSDFVGDNTGNIILVSGENNTSIDAGIMREARIGDKIWYDVNGDGLQNNGESGLSGVTLKLLDVNNSNNEVSSTITNQNGDYLFRDIEPGTYKLQVVLPLASQNMTQANVGSDDTIDSDFVGGYSQNVTITGNEIITHIDGGVTFDGTIGDYVWLDTNGDGIQDATESGIAGIELALRKDGVIVASTTSSSTGSYLFSNVDPGTYTITIESTKGGVVSGASQGSDASKDSDFTNNVSNPIVITSGAKVTDIDLGIYYYSTISNRVWNDLNANGLQDAGEPGMAGVSLTIKKGSTTIGTTTTNASGIYAFNNLVPGTYKVFITLPTNTTLTQANAGSDDTIDSDFVNNQTDDIVVTSGTINTTIDAGLMSEARIGDFVWNDLNLNGIQDVNEPGISGITVTLLDVNNSDAVVASMRTSSSGYYQFKDIEPGTYKLQFTLGVLSQNFTQANAGSDDALDSDVVNGFSPQFNITGNEFISNIDAGITFDGSIGNLVWLDTNGNGIQDAGENGVAGVELALKQGTTTIATAKSSSNGSYVFRYVNPGTYKIEVTNSNGGILTQASQGSDVNLDSDFVNTSTGDITIGNGTSITNIDLGIYYASKIINRVWNDLNANGLQDAGEKGYPNVTLQLKQGDTLIDSDQTNASGVYEFTNVKPGVYQVHIVLPDNTNLTQVNAGTNDHIDSDFTNNKTGDITIISGTVDTSIDAGLLDEAKIGDRVWHDTNFNGIQDNDEIGIGGIIVKLLDVNNSDQVVSTVVTNDLGKYQFINVEPGTYRVQIVTTGRQFMTEANQGSDDSLDTDFVNGYSQQLIITKNEIITNIDAGIAYKGSIGNLVWIDLNANGIYDAGEQGANDVELALKQGSTTVATAKSSSTGSYSFNDVLPGTYKIVIISTNGAVVSPANMGGNDEVDSDFVNNETSEITLASNGKITNIDLGIYYSGGISNRVWNDKNANGLQDAGEPGFPNVTLKLKQGSTVLSTVTTDASGLYKFVSLVPGIYQVEVVLPDNTNLTIPNAGTNDDIDSDFATTISSDITVVNGIMNNTIDVGLVKEASVGNFVWHDLDLDGIQDQDEPGMPGITLKLLDVNNNNAVVATKQTTNLGKYLFDNIEPGTYKIQMILPVSSQSITTPNVGTDDNIDSDFVGGYSQEFTITANEEISNIDGGVYFKGSISNRVWNDLDADGIQDAGEPGLAGIELELVEGSTVVASTISSSSGSYSFKSIAPGTYHLNVKDANDGTISMADQGSDDSLDSDFINGISQDIVIGNATTITNVSLGVYYLASIANRVWNDTNANGLQDSGELGISNVTLKLLQDSQVVSTTTTSSIGTYAFKNLKPGVYQVEVVPVENSIVTSANVGSNDEIDSDFVNNLTGNITLTSGENNTSIDAGLKFKGSIGDYIWHDTNANGLQDENELGFVNVTVNLKQGDTVVATTTTSSRGGYLFENIDSGIYQVEIVMPTNTYSSPKGVGTNQNINSKFNDGLSDDITVDYASKIRNIDGGIYYKGTIGNKVWDDLNRNGLQDANEPGIGGVQVELIQDSQVVMTTTSNDTGYYQFNNVIPGTYNIKFTNEGYTPTTQGVSGNGSAIDFNGVISDFILKSKQIRLDADAGYFK